MTVKELLNSVETHSVIPEYTLANLTNDSRKVEEGTVFFCLKGEEQDGHNYAAQALLAGAVAIVVERDLGLEKQVIVSNTHQAYGVACGNYYGNPAKKLKLLGVTGTNGKTTITYIAKDILQWAGKKVGLVGTIENQIDGVILQARHTTPDPFELHALFDRMVEAGCEYVVMEVSSHGLEQHRLAGCHFVSAGFTNLTPDHLDYHGTMENYYLAKAKLFSMADYGVINEEDSFGKRLISEVDIPISRFSSVKSGGDLWAENIIFSEKGSRFTMGSGGETSEISYIQPGLFSVENALCAAGLCLGAGLSFEEVSTGLSKVVGIPGRFEILKTETPYTIVRDFAHSPDGLEKLLSTVRDFHKGRIVTLFGCAGERDRGKRKEMSRAVAKYSDFAIMTADNPRSEPVEQILKDAMPGLESSSTPYKIFGDRFDALVWALNNSQPGDFLILAGKGHEDYQVLSFGSINFNEKKLVQDLLVRIGQGETWESKEGGESNGFFFK